ncbi:MAG: hypothetical protein M0Z41_13775 [Peptococcaceae bacterium]|jgi:hypothetical protein|nr:hypothetical protein [Peptococcaceae bacterium]
MDSHIERQKGAERSLLGGIVLSELTLAMQAFGTGPGVTITLAIIFTGGPWV